MPLKDPEARREYQRERYRTDGSYRRRRIAASIAYNRKHQKRHAQTALRSWKARVAVAMEIGVCVRCEEPKGKARATRQECFACAKQTAQKALAKRLAESACR